MTDRQVAVMAVCAVASAWVARPLPIALTCVAVLAALAARRPALVWIAVAAAASTSGARAWDGVRSAPTTGMVAGTATVVRDPEWLHGAVRVELRLDGRRLQAYARGEPATVLAARLAGEEVALRGRRRPVPDGSRSYLARRHIGARLTVEAATVAGDGGAVTQVANELRRTLVRGAASLADRDRALFTGIVLGDDRDQSAEQVDDFRAAGLSHLLAVSGQNVAFVLALAQPFLRRLGLRGRLGCALAILALFGVVTRWEPSVVRAVAMAAIATFAATAGRPASTVRLLGLAVTALVLVDPMLAGSIGFLLSVAACCGIALFGPLLERRLPTPIAITVAAQVGVAPVMLPAFGTIPTASLPANVMAVPAAGPLMMWGLVAGIPAGLIGGTGAGILHLPTRLLLWWIARVAAVSAAVPLPHLTPRGAVMLSCAVAVGWLVHRWWPRRLPAVTVASAAVACVLTALAPAYPRTESGRTIAAGVRLWRHDGAVVVVVGDARPGSLMQALRQAGIRRIDILVLEARGTTAAEVVAAAAHRSDVRLVLAPAGHRVPGAHDMEDRASVRAGALEVTVTPTEPRVVVRVASARAPPPGRAAVRRRHPRPRHGDPQPHDRLLLRQGRVLPPRRPAAPR